MLDWCSNRCVCVLSVVIASLSVSVSAQETGVVFADVGGAKVMQVEYESAFHVASREKFFHADVSEEALDKLRLDVAQQVVDRELLLQRARSLDIQLDPESVSEAVGVELRRYRLDTLKDDQVARLKSLVLEDVRERLMLDAVKRKVVDATVVPEAEVRKYYRDNIDKFTTPEQIRVSVILLKVAPSSLPLLWEAAEEEAERLRARLVLGADFATLASIHSGDASAEQGGDLGFVHRGMLSKEAQAAVDGLSVGQISPVVVLLQGVSLFKLVDKLPAKVNDFDDVLPRAESLLKRELERASWTAYIQALRDTTEVKIHDKRVLGLM